MRDPDDSVCFRTIGFIRVVGVGVDEYEVNNWCADGFYFYNSVDANERILIEIMDRSRSTNAHVKRTQVRS